MVRPFFLTVLSFFLYLEAMKAAKEFLVHVELKGLFEVFVIPSADGSILQFFPYPGKEKDFPAYLAERFKHLGEPSDCTFHSDIKCYEVTFRGLRFNGPEDALTRLTAGR
jgi:hypothetical protein